MNKPTSLFTAPPFSPLIQKNRRCSCKRHIAVLQSLIKCNDWVIEKIYSSITLQCWLHEACGFWKKKVASQREKERDKEKEKEREREYFHWVTQRAFCQTSWADLQRWWRKRLSRRKGWAGEGSASGGALTRPPPSFCVYRDRRPPGNRRRYVIDQVLLQAERSYC